MKLDMIGIIVDDMEKAAEFYEHLGFKIRERFGEDYLELDNDGVRISLNTQEMVAGIYGYKPQAIGDRLELAFTCDTADAVDETVKRMQSLGYQVFKEAWDAPWGQRYAIIKDVDGNLISLFAPLDE